MRKVVILPSTMKWTEKVELPWGSKQWIYQTVNDVEMSIYFSVPNSEWRCSRALYLLKFGVKLDAGTGALASKWQSKLFPHELLQFSRSLFGTEFEHGPVRCLVHSLIGDPMVPGRMCFPDKCADLRWDEPLWHSIAGLFKQCGPESFNFRALSASSFQASLPRIFPCETPF